MSSRAASPVASSTRRRVPVATVVLGAVVVILAVTLVVLRADDARPHAEVGELYEYPYAEDPLDHPGEVLLPWARVLIAAGEPSDELPTPYDAPANLQAPDGGSFVRVEVDYPDDAGVPFAAVAPSFVAQTEVVLRADGRDYLLNGPGDLELDPDELTGRGDSRWVAVDGRPDDLEVRVTVDGVTQVVDASDGSVEEGRAASLADLPSSDALVDTGQTCGKPDRIDRTDLAIVYRPSLGCSVDLAFRTAYVDGLGWAEDGREFLVVDLAEPGYDLEFMSGRGSGTDYWDADPTLRVRLGDLRPLATAIDSTGGLGDSGQYVFDVAAGAPLDDLMIDLVAEARLGEPFVTRRREVHYRWTVPLEVLS